MGDSISRPMLGEHYSRVFCSYCMGLSAETWLWVNTAPFKAWLWPTSTVCVVFEHRSFDRKPWPWPLLALLHLTVANVKQFKQASRVRWHTITIIMYCNLQLFLMHALYSINTWERANFMALRDQVIWGAVPAAYFIRQYQWARL